MFEGIKAAIVKDRYAFFKDFFDNFYNVDVLAPERISDQAWQASFNVAAGSSRTRATPCVDTWLTDFREDLPKIDVPTLVVHGTKDRILPFEVTAARLSDLIDGRQGRAGRGWSAQHRLDAPRGGQPSTAGLRDRRMRAPGAGCAIRREARQPPGRAPESPAPARAVASKVWLAGGATIGGTGP